MQTSLKTLSQCHDMLSLEQGAMYFLAEVGRHDHMRSLWQTFAVAEGVNNISCCS